MKKLIFINFIIFTNYFVQAKEVYHHIYLDEQSLSTRIGFKYNYKENLSSNFPQKEQQCSIYGEYQLFPFYSIYLNIPYTLKWSEGSENRKYLDHIEIQNKFLIRSSFLEYVFGLAIDLPRYHNKAGDVAGNIGYIEPYVGLIFKSEPLWMKFSIHWNTQTNTKFKEEEEQFQKKWIYNFSIGYTPSHLAWKFWLETQYQNIYDPQVNKKNLYFIGPAISYSFSSIEIELIYLILSKENLYNKQLMLQLQQKF